MKHKHNWSFDEFDGTRTCTECRKIQIIKWVDKI